MRRPAADSGAGGWGSGPGAGVVSRRSGLALAEVLVSSTVLLLMMGLACALLLGALGVTRELAEPTLPPEALAQTLERWSRWLHSTRAIMEPSRAALEGGHAPGQAGQGPLWLRVETAAGPRELGLSWEARTHRLVELEGASRRELAPAEGLVVRWRDGRLEVRVETGPHRLPWSLAVSTAPWEAP